MHDRPEKTSQKSDQQTEQLPIYFTHVGTSLAA